jgi:hypothetical protein
VGHDTLKEALHEIQEIIEDKIRERDELNVEIRNLQSTATALQNVLRFHESPAADHESQQ